MELKLEHIAQYLPYQLKCKDCYGNTFTLSNIQIDSPTKARVNSYGGHGGLGLFNIKPFLRPLTDLYNKITVNDKEFIPTDILQELGIMDSDTDIVLAMSFPEDAEKLLRVHVLFEKLSEWHFDYFLLIEKGLAININELK